jgi:putative ABC transport system permease protein
MNELFGIPTGTLAAVLATSLGISLALVAALAIRNRILLKLGVRNVPRRPGRSGLIVVGLMLGTTIIAAAMTTGDTMSHTIRTAAVTALGQTDELVSTRGAEDALASGEEIGSGGQAAAVRYFPEVLLYDIHAAARNSRAVDGVAPAIVEQVSVVAPRTRQTEPRVTLFASDPGRLDGFGEITLTDGRPIALAELKPGVVFLNADAADELGARQGDVVQVLAGGRTRSVRVGAIVDYDGTGTDGPAALMPLKTAQRLLDKEGLIKHVLISNTGGATDGVRHTDSVLDALRPVLDRYKLEAAPSKRDALETADQEGSAFMSLFTTFGSFSIVAGILLVFLIFVMLSAERRGEMGIARAIGTRRGHLVQMFVYEGLAYDVLAAAVGALLGVAAAFAMVTVLAGALSEFGVEIQRQVRLTSIVVAYSIGVLLTLAVVAFSSWRVSRLNIVTAVRGLPDPPHPRRRWRRMIAIVLGAVFSVLLIASGISAVDALTFNVGVSLALMTLIPVGRALGVGERLAYTVGGLGLVVWWLLPFDVLETLTGEPPRMDFSIFIVSGLLVVLGAVWAIVYNADVLLAAVSTAFGRIRALTPVLRMAIAYPLRSRFRTGVTLAMFTLVVFTLVMGAATSGSFISAYDDEREFAGGFEIRADSVAASPVDDMTGAVERTPSLADRVDVVASQSVLPAKARQLDTPVKDASYPVYGFDDNFLNGTTYEFAAMARGYKSGRDVWNAIRTTPGLAVVDSLVVPRRENFNFGVPPDFRLSGFYLEDGTFDPVAISVRDPQTDKSVGLRVIGVLKDSVAITMYGISTSQRTLASAFGDRVRPTTYHFSVPSGTDAEAVATDLEAKFIANGLEAQAMSDLLHDAVATSWTFNRLILAFMGLGLLVGVAALGVISARSVVERRQQIGVLRSIGFQRRMVQAAFLLESSFISLVAIFVGTTLGLILAYNVINDTSESQGTTNVELVVPWGTLGVVFFIVYAASLITTLLPALRASHVEPAEALRYQ